MKEREVRETAFAMPLTSPAYPKGPYRFTNREYLIITYRTDPAENYFLLLFLSIANNIYFYTEFFAQTLQTINLCIDRQLINDCEPYVRLMPNKHYNH